VTTTTGQGAAGAGTVAVAKRPGRWRRRLILTGVLLVPIILVALYTAAVMALTFSQGDRVGYVQKLSKKGWLCRTWEGELAMASMPGAMPEVFNFSIRDDKVAAQVNEAQGKKVVLQYKQKRGLPTTCFGETEYFITGVRPAAQ
jgi:hypothetical protein